MIIFKHQEFLVVDKPAGCLTVPSRFELTDGRRVLGRELEKSVGQRLFPVHRLDFEVSGLVLFARSSTAQKKFNFLFESRQVQKTYEAWSQARDFSHWPAELPMARDEFNLQEPQTWKCRILRGKRRSYESPHGDESVTEASYIDGADILRWHIKPLTGRPHQIRFEMSRHGFPILGDQLYGSRREFGTDRIALRAVRLEMEKIYAEMPAVFTVEGLQE